MDNLKDKTSASITSHILIRDKATQAVLVNKSVNVSPVKTNHDRKLEKENERI